MSACLARAPGLDQAYLPDQRKNFYHDGVRINYYEFGQGEPMLFLHGFGGASYTWRQVSPAFARNRRVFLLDLKGFGLSERPRDDKYRVDDQAEIVTSFIVQKNLEKITLVGHSLGGAVALLTYFKVNQVKLRITSLILIDSACYPESLPPFIKILRLPVINILLSKVTPTRLAVAKVLKKSFYDDKQITDEMLSTYIYYNRLPGSDYAARKTAELIIPPNMGEVIPKLAEITIPVLLLWGYGDEIIPLAYGLKLHRDIPGSRLVSLKHCGHIPPEERPSETVNEMAKFLNSLAG
jgi:pimeloyl-ACP methyl ester carboxylesterase